MELSEAAQAILEERYLQRDNDGRCVEDVVDMLRRVAQRIAEPALAFGENEHFWAERFFQMMERMEFLPNSPTLMNAGMPARQLAACFPWKIIWNLFFQPSR
jgi:ribonucleoside-diphosphate reductase alpha chain